MKSFGKLKCLENQEDFNKSKTEDSFPKQKAKLARGVEKNCSKFNAQKKNPATKEQLMGGKSESDVFFSAVFFGSSAATRYEEDR